MTVGDYAIDIVNGIPCALKATLDWSAPGRQGWILSLSNPKAAAAFKQQTMSFFSATAHKKFVEALETHPLTKAMQDTGLYLSNLADNTNLNQREEQFMSRIFGDEPLFRNEKFEAFRQGLTYPIRWSERTFSDYFDKIRVESYMHFAKQVFEYNERSGITDNETYQKQLEGVARFVNVVTGRASLGRYEDNAAVLNLPFFSIRNWKSRIDVINPAFYAALPPGARGAALKSFGTFAGATALALFLLKKSDIADVETDFESPDFLKVRSGQYRFDISASIAQNLRYVAQMVKGAINVDAAAMAKDSLQYGRGKLSPLPSAIVSMGTGTKISGEPTSAKAEASGLLTPISIEQLTNGAKADGTIGALLSAPDLLGFGVSRFDNSQEVGFKLAEIEREWSKAVKGSPEEKELFKQVKAWRDYYYQAKKGKGELPAHMSGGAESEQDEEKDEENAPTVEYFGEVKEPELNITLQDKIDFYKKNKNTLFSFAADELESNILQNAENLRLRGRLKKSDEAAIKEIIPEWSSLRENDGLDHRPNALKKLPKLEKLSKLPKLPNAPAPLTSASAARRVTRAPVDAGYRGHDVFKTQYNEKIMRGRQSENVIDLRAGAPVRELITSIRYGKIADRTSRRICRKNFLNYRKS